MESVSLPLGSLDEGEVSDILIAKEHEPLCNFLNW